MSYIREFDEAWASDFLTIAALLRTYLPADTHLHHVGSTSVPGMPAKDIIDIDIECPRGSMACVIEQLSLAGYKHTGDQGIPTRKAFHACSDTEAAELRSHHLYACEADSPELHRHLCFRDYLIAHPDRALWLAQEKRRANAQASSRADYIERKAASYAQLLTQAETWASSR